MEKQILKNKRIVLTRKNNEPLASELSNLGADVLELPLIDVKIKADAEIAEEIFADIATYQWLIFSSVNGVNGFFTEFFKKFSDIRCVGPCRIACVGKQTAQELKKYFLTADVIPEIENAEKMAAAMVEFETLENLTVLNICGNLQDKSFVKVLEEKGGAIVDSFPVYETTLLELSTKDKDLKDFVENGADAIYFASASAVESFAKNAKNLSLNKGAKTPKAVSIGSRTSLAMKKFGIKPAAEAQNPSAILETIKNLLA